MGSSTTRGTIGLAIASAVALVATLGPGTLWLSGQIEDGLEREAKSRLTSRSIDATVEASGRDLLVRADDAAAVEEALSVLGDLSGARTVKADPAQPPTSATPQATPVNQPSSPASALASPSPTPSAASATLTPTAPGSPTVSPPSSPAPVPADLSVPPILFDGASTALPADAGSSLDRAAALLLAHPTLRVSLSGHTDNGLTPPQRLALGLSRAEAASAALQQRGVTADRIRVESQADRRPVGDNSTAVGRAANRRVEIVIEEVD